MSRRSNYILMSVTEDRVIIKDIGPWDVYPSVSNNAERVVEELMPKLNGRRLFYYDSEGEFGELVIKDGKFFGFGSGK